MATSKQTAKAPTRRQLARRDKEEKLQRLVTLIAAGLGAAILIILVVGATIEISKANAVVAKVGDEKLVARDFQSRQRYERELVQQQIYQYEYYLDQISATSTVTGSAETDSFTQQLQISLANLENSLSSDQANLFGGRVLDDMIEEELVREESSARSLSVSEDDLNIAVEKMIGYDRNAITDTLTITETAELMTEDEYQDYYQQFVTNVLKPTRFSERAFRRMVEAGLLREKLVEDLGKSTSTIQDQVDVTVFVLSTEEEAQKVRDRVNVDGATPETVIDELSADDSDTSYGVALGWSPVGYIGSLISNDAEKVAFATSVGKASEPLAAGESTYYVIYVGGHEERELAESFIEDAYQAAYDTWLAEQKESRVEYLKWEAAIVTP